MQLVTITGQLEMIMAMDSLLHKVKAIMMGSRRKVKFMTEFGLGELMLKNNREEEVLLPGWKMVMGVPNPGGATGEERGKWWFLMAWSRGGYSSLLEVWVNILGVGRFRDLERESGAVLNLRI
jgi:hypothetical protein